MSNSIALSYGKKRASDHARISSLYTLQILRVTNLPFIGRWSRSGEYESSALALAAGEAILQKDINARAIQVIDPLSQEVYFVKQESVPAVIKHEKSSLPARKATYTPRRKRNLEPALFRVISSVFAVLFAVLAIVFVVLLVVGVSAGFAWIAWKLWIFVVPYFFPGAPGRILHPPFKIFWATITLLSIIKALILGSKSSSSSDSVSSSR